jgi:hypothetical protein
MPCRSLFRRQAEYLRVPQAAVSPVKIENDFAESDEQVLFSVRQLRQKIADIGMINAADIDPSFVITQTRPLEDRTRDAFVRSGVSGG